MINGDADRMMRLVCRSRESRRRVTQPHQYAQYELAPPWLIRQIRFLPAGVRSAGQAEFSTRAAGINGW